MPPYKIACLEWDSNLGLHLPTCVNIVDELNPSATMADSSLIYCVQIFERFFGKNIVANFE